ncbi:Thiamine-monophosphate kinase (EC 2.7.4.16) [Pseudomonas sp. FEN]|nr:Thiamine-monophosphate kinase (EC 2.7.4.16) [Pseudomonas sp. FEN]
MLDKLAPRLREAEVKAFSADPRLPLHGRVRADPQFLRRRALCAGRRGRCPGIGDDCALLSVPAGEQLAISTDTLVAGVHFADPCDPFLLGQRALAVAASDLAAMGATPLAFTLALTLPHNDASWLQAFAHGLNLMAQHLTCACGGDTTVTLCRR